VKFKLLIRPEVDADLLKAENWYEQQQDWIGPRLPARNARKNGGPAAQPLWPDPRKVDMTEMWFCH
jgi:hypothetical protein